MHNTTPPQPWPPRRERGAATLIVTLVLLAATLLATLFANRDAFYEQRIATNQQRSTLAFEAAEAGLEWALAQLNDNQRIGADCLGSAGAADSFRERFLSLAEPSGQIDGRSWNDAGTSRPLQAACVRSASGWDCACPTNAHPAPALPAGTALAPAFAVRFAAGGRPGLVRVIAAGCTSLAGACRPGTAVRVDASAQIEALFGRVPALRTLPSAPLVTPGAVNAGSAALGAHHPDPATGGIAIHAGGAIEAAMARITPPAGTPLAAALVDHDSALANLGAEALFVSLFGLDKATWQRQGVVSELACQGACTSQLLAAIGDGVVHRQIHVGGNLRLDGPAVIGAPGRPVIVVVDGDAAFVGAVQVHGIVHARQIHWSGSASPGAFVRGALIAEAGYSGDGAPDLFHDGAVFAALKGRTGAFARVSGSWRDF